MPATKRLYYGWIVVALSFFTVALSATVQQSFIVIFPAMLKDFAWSRTVFSLAPALFGLVLSCNAFVVGTLSDRIDIKRLIPIGAAVTAAGYEQGSSQHLPEGICLHRASGPMLPRPAGSWQSGETFRFFRRLIESRHSGRSPCTERFLC